MNIKTIMTSLSIAILTLCLLNVAAATTSNPASVPHSKIVADAAASQPTTLTFTAPAQAKINKWVTGSGSLTEGEFQYGGVSSAIIKIQQWQGKEDTWDPGDIWS